MLIRVGERFLNKRNTALAAAYSVVDASLGITSNLSLLWRGRASVALRRPGVPLPPSQRFQGNTAMRHHLPCLLALLASGSLHAAGFSADQLIAKNLEARGGADKLRAVTSQHVLAKQRLGGGLEAKTESWAIAPGHWRDEFSLQGLTAVEAWDGAQAWAINPFEGRRDPQKLSADDAKDMIESADFTGPLLDYQAKGSKVEYLGTEDIDGTDAHKLRVTFKNGDSAVVYLDPDQFLEIRIVHHRMIRGQERVISTDVGEYEKVDGLYFPFEVGNSHIDTMTLNPSIDDRQFAYPVTAAVAPGAKK